MFGNCRVAYLLNPCSCSQFPVNLVNSLPGDWKEQISFIWEPFPPLKILSNRVEGTSVNWNRSSSFGHLAIPLPYLLYLDEDGSIFKVYVLRPYPDEFAYPNPSAPRDADKQGISESPGNGNEPFYLLRLKVSFQVSDIDYP